MIASLRQGVPLIRHAARRFLMSLLFLACPFLLLALVADAQSVTGSRSRPLLIRRPVRSWEFLCAVGKRAGVFGSESGRLEAWVYPLKILREFHVTIHHDGKVLPAESLVRTIEARPE